jgi:transposase
VTVSLGCLWRTLDRLGLRLKKKSLRAAEQNSPGIRRIRFHSDLDGRRPE